MNSPPRQRATPIRSLIRGLNLWRQSSSLRVFINVIQVLTTIKSSKKVFYAKSLLSGS